MRAIYLDHTATTPVDPRVLDAMVPYMEERYGNASSIHSFGRQAKDALEKARSVIAAALGAQPGEITFTSGGTESDNLAIAGSLRIAGRKTGRRQIVTSIAEHHAVLDTAAEMQEEGFTTVGVPVNQYGSTGHDAVREALGPTTALVSIMHANNEVGTINPIRAIADAAHAAGAVIHTDAVQSFGKIAVDVRALDVDMATVSAHKIYGPKGIGALYVTRGIEILPLMHGGGQERGRRPGTENVALAVGFAKAVELVLDDREREMARLAMLRDALERSLCDRFPFLLVNGHPTERLPHILSVSVDSARCSVVGEMLVPNLDLEGVAVSSGSACTSGSIQPSHVLLAMGRDEATARATVRFSFGRQNSREDVVDTVARLDTVFTRMMGC